MFTFTPVSNQLVMLSHFNSTPVDTSSIKTFYSSKYPFIRIDIYEDNTWGIYASEINLNCFSEEVLELVFKWGDSKILFSKNGHVHIFSNVINLGCSGGAFLSLRSDLIGDIK